MPDELILYVVFDHPDDYPDNFVVRQQIVTGDASNPIRMGDHWITATLDEARQAIPPGLHCLGRLPDDEPAIVEAWL